MPDLNQQPQALLLLPRLRVQNANAISSPLTWGFPSPTAFLGFAHALERHLAADYGQVFDGVGIVCHHFEAQTYHPNRRGHLVFTQSRNPVYLKRDGARFIAEGTPPAIVEEGRAHFEVSLVLALRHGFAEALEGKQFAQAAYRVVQGMRLAGGSILPPDPLREAVCLNWPEYSDEQRPVLLRLLRRLLPGFALVHRPDLLAERQEALQKNNPGEASRLDALLDLVRLNYAPVLQVPPTAPATPSSASLSGLLPQEAAQGALPKEEGGRVPWEVNKRPGWLVPLSVGYAGISPLYPPGEVAATRDVQTPFRFVESLYSIGQWISPHRLTRLEQLLWHYTGEPEAGVYRCANHYARHLPQTLSL